MEWLLELDSSSSSNNNSSNNNNVLVGNSYVVVMTEEQVEVLRKQIAAYATICEQLVDLHKRFSALAQRDHCSLSSASGPAGMRFGHSNSDPLAASGHRIMSRQRWSPSPMQLQILESYFNQGDGTPSKERILEITSELENYGNIKISNVYNWFQNRRARSKRKLQSSAPPNNAESEVETEMQCQEKNKKAKPVAPRSCGNISASSGDVKAKMVASQSCENIPARLEDSSQTPEISSDVHPVYLDGAVIPGTALPSCDMKSSGSIVQSSFDDSMFAEQGIHGSFEFAEADGYYGLII